MSEVKEYPPEDLTEDQLAEIDKAVEERFGHSIVSPDDKEMFLALIGLIAKVRG